MYKAFQGPNGWYAAWVDREGFHHQPASGGNLSQRSAVREAARLNREEDESLVARDY